MASFWADGQVEKIREEIVRIPQLLILCALVAVANILFVRNPLVMGSVSTILDAISLRVARA